jgi:hypothetical protein
MDEDQAKSEDRIIPAGSGGSGKPSPLEAPAKVVPDDLRKLVVSITEEKVTRMMRFRGPLPPPDL